MRADKQDVVHALSASIKALQLGVDTHCCLVASLLDNNVDERNLGPLMNLYNEKAREALLKDAIKEAIDVIEVSRKAFKSKKLEVLRKKLTYVLINAN